MAQTDHGIVRLDHTYTGTSSAVRSRASIGLFVALITTLSLLTSCKEQISGIGSDYFNDKIALKTLNFSDTSALHFSNYIQQLVLSPTHTFQINYFGTTVFVGKVNDQIDNFQAWGLFRFQSVLGDTAQHLDSLTMQLHVIPYRYGDLTSTHLDLGVYAEANQKVNDSTTSLKMSDLSATPLGTFVGDVRSDTSSVVTIKLDTAQFNKFDPSTIALVVVPNAMTNIRGFASAETPTSGFAPQLQYAVHTDTGSSYMTYRPAVLDFHIISDQTTTPAGEFMIRGSSSQRELLQFDLAKLTAGDSITQFSTVNNAVLVLHLDPAQSRRSEIATDTLGPAVLQLTAPSGVDSIPIILSYGVSDGPGTNTYRFQIRSLVEQWLRQPTLNFGLELRGGYFSRTFGTRNDAIDDYTVNRWTFFGQEAADATKRPNLIITYSILK